MDYKIRKANIKDAKSVNELLTLLIRDEKNMILTLMKNAL